MVNEVRIWLKSNASIFCNEFKKQVDFLMNEGSKLPHHKDLIQELNKKSENICDHLLKSAA